MTLYKLYSFHERIIININKPFRVLLWEEGLVPFKSKTFYKRKTTVDKRGAHTSGMQFFFALLRLISLSSPWWRASSQTTTFLPFLILGVNLPIKLWFVSPQKKFPSVQQSTWDQLTVHPMVVLAYSKQNDHSSNTCFLRKLHVNWLPAHYIAINLTVHLLHAKCLHNSQTKVNIELNPALNT